MNSCRPCWKRRSGSTPTWPYDAELAAAGVEYRCRPDDYSAELGKQVGNVVLIGQGHPEFVRPGRGCFLPRSDGFVAKRRGDHQSRCSSVVESSVVETLGLDTGSPSRCSAGGGDQRRM